MFYEDLPAPPVTMPPMRNVIVDFMDGALDQLRSFQKDPERDNCETIICDGGEDSDPSCRLAATAIRDLAFVRPRPGQIASKLPGGDAGWDTYQSADAPCVLGPVGVPWTREHFTQLRAEGRTTEAWAENSQKVGVAQWPQPAKPTTATTRKTTAFEKALTQKA